VNIYDNRRRTNEVRCLGNRSQRGEEENKKERQKWRREQKIETDKIL